MLDAHHLGQFTSPWPGYTAKLYGCWWTDKRRCGVVGDVPADNCGDGFQSEYSPYSKALSPVYDEVGVYRMSLINEYAWISGEKRRKWMRSKQASFLLFARIRLGSPDARCADGNVPTMIRSLERFRLFRSIYYVHLLTRTLSVTTFIAFSILCLLLNTDFWTSKMVVEATKPVKNVQSPSHKTLPSLMPIHDDVLKDADDNRLVVEKMTIVERSDFLYNFEDLPREVVENIISHCDHLYPWLFVCKVRNRILDTNASDIHRSSSALDFCSARWNLLVIICTRAASRSTWVKKPRWKLLSQCWKAWSIPQIHRPERHGVGSWSISCYRV